jgi:hypothetical protein
MRKLLAAAVALAPLALAAGAAQAQVIIDDTRTTPIQTSTADGGAPADVTIDEDGAIELDDGAAITLDSDNDVTIESGGEISFEDAADGSTGILVLGGNTGSVEVDGRISVVTEYEPEDDDDDGDLDGPLAEGADRYAIRVTGPDALDGDITLGRSAAINVEGDTSYGISLETALTGDLTARGAIAVTGDNSYGIRTQGDIAGDVWLGGTVSVVGENSSGVSLEGDIGGALLIETTINTSGFRYPARPNETAVEKLDDDDLLIGGSALSIAGNVAGGVLLAVAPAEEDEDEDDEDGNGVPDNEQSTAKITSYGSAPAVVVGSTTQDVTLGVVGVDDEAYGFINRGSITAAGVYDGVASTAIRFGVDGGQAVTIDGGVFSQGPVEANAREADATAVRFSSGAATDVFNNAGATAALIVTEEDHTATALQIDTGATVGSIYNSGRLVASAGGEAASAVAIRDLSGTLTDIQNIGLIQANTAPILDENGEADPITGEAVAIDVRANTTGVTLTQLVQDIPDDEPAPIGGREPVIRGDILLGSGSDMIDIRDGFVFGDIDFGGGADSLQISGGAEVHGALSGAGGLLTINVADGLLDAQQTGRVDIAGLNVGADGDLIFSVDPDAGTAGGFNVTGTASFADGAGIGVRFESLLDQAERYTVIQAGDLQLGDLDQTSLEENSPFLFVVEADGNETTGELFVDVRRRTAEEIGMITSEASAFDAVYEALRADDELRDAFLSQNDADGLLDVYEQMLPDHSGGALISLASGVDAVTRALSGRNNSAARGETSAWLQEINFYADKETNEAYGFKSEGFGFAGGVERGTRLGAIGVSTAFTSSDLEDPAAAAEERLSASLLELGLYWRAQGGSWTTWARAAGGYASFESVRQFVGEGVLRRADADWNGYTVTAAAGASYERSFGRYSLRPEVVVEYFGLNEDGFQETGGGDGFDLAIEDREGHIFSSTAALNFGMGFGENQWLRPEFRVGWRQIISHDGGLTTARFLSGGPAFDLAADSLEGGGPIVGLRLNVGNELGMLAIEADAEMLDDYIRYALLLRASFRF